jgi:anti-sigma regulatory factor (Ser/Thr protein kinase)
MCESEFFGGKTAGPIPALSDTLPWQISLRLETDPQESDVLRATRKIVHAAAKTVGAADPVAYEIELAVGEALSNAWLHAYGGGIGIIELDTAFDGTYFTFTIHDRGAPITALPAIPRDLPQKGRGRGLYLIGQLMDEAEVLKREGQGVALRMRKRVR